MIKKLGLAQDNNPDDTYGWGLHMISKLEAIQKLKKMGIMVADDNSIVTVLIPEGISFETGLKDVRSKLAEIGYDASFCVKQTGKNAPGKGSNEVLAEQNEEEVLQPEEEIVSDEELSSYMAVDDDGQFSLDLGF